MFDKKKINFWRLVFIFGALVIMTLFFLWKSPIDPKSQMMNVSMGNMAKQMHASNISINDLLGSGEGQSQSQTNMMSSHHQNQSPTILKLHFLSTSIIYLLLPLIIGGAILLAIVWIR